MGLKSFSLRTGSLVILRLLPACLLCELFCDVTADKRGEVFMVSSEEFYVSVIDKHYFIGETLDFYEYPVVGCDLNGEENSREYIEDCIVLSL